MEMFQIRILSALVVVLCVLQTQGASKYYQDDENRPYEFGFNIDGEQHRHEKKDENGLIEGEFGFITADGVYHVTVYATDENGNFKILSMKNIRTRPYPTAPERKGNSLPFPPSEQKPIEEGPKLNEPANSCASCSIPTTKSPELTDYAVVSKDNPAYNQPEYPQPEYPQPEYPQQEYPQPEYPPQYPEYPPENNLPETYPEQPQYYPEQPQEYPQEYPERNPKQYEGVPPNFPPGQDPTKPVLFSAQMQIVPPDTDINTKAPGERDGLPNGLKQDDMELLLYTFNYTVGFHGHYEEGYTNGFKKGYYYVTGRNGVRTRVDYEADDKGFRPKISQEVLDLLSEDVPKEETEKDAKYGLKGYEFKWIYYPVENKQR